MDYSFSFVLKTLLVLSYTCKAGAPDNVQPQNSHSHPSFLSQIFDTGPDKAPLSSCHKNASIGIIGAGFAGLSASRKLLSAGFKNVHIFEAENRVGGRVYPIPFDDGYLQHGAEYINGKANPIFEMAMRLGLVTSEADDDEHMEDAEFWSGKCPISESLIEAFHKFSENLEDDYYDMAKDPESWHLSVGEVYEKSYEEFLKTTQPTSKEKRMLDALSRFYRSYYEAEWSAPIEKLALHNYAQWDDRSEKMASFSMNKLGYKAILDQVKKGIPENTIFLNSKVTHVDYTGPKTILTLENGSNFEYDFVIVTVPLGHLKKNAREMFTPHLPQKKLKAINALGFGSNLKVFLVYDRPFLPENSSTIVPTHIEKCGPKSSLSDYLHSVDTLAWNPNVLVLWFNGKGPELLSQLTDEEVNQEITQIFKNSLQKEDIPMAKQVIRTSWISNPNFYGTYSFITPESSQLSPKGAYDLMARPIYKNKKPRIMFAGEATHSRIYQTTIVVLRISKNAICQQWHT